MTNPFPIRNVLSVLVQTASGGLPDSDDGWTTQYWLRFERGSWGAGQIVGDAMLEQRFGVVTPQNDPTQVLTGTAPGIFGGGIDPDLLGQLVRIIVEDPDGDIEITDANGVNTYTAFWWGSCISFAVAPDNRSTSNAGGTATWMCAGITALLDKITINSGFVLPLGAGAAWIDPGYFPPFNNLPNGDRSASTVAMGTGTAYAHDLSTLNVGHLWTAAQAITTLLTGCASPTINDTLTGWTWALDDPCGVLNFNMERTDINGLTLLQAISTIANQKRGITWVASVDGSTVTLTFWPGLATAITIGSFTFPASTNTATYTASGNVFCYGIVINEDETSVYDIIECRGAHPWVGLTLDYSASGSPALAEGWDSEDATNWASDPTYSGTDQVWRRFTVSTSWYGNQYESTTEGIRNALTTDSYGQFTGARTYDGESANLPPAIYPIERMLPCGVVFETLGGYRLAPFQPPVVVVGSEANGWVDWSQLAKIEVQCFPPAIIIDLDTSFGATLSSDIGDGSSMLVTLGFREPQPLRVNWMASPDTWPTTTPRIKMIDIPEIEQWIMLGGSVTGVTSDNTATTTIADDTFTRDDTERLQQILALAVARYGYPTVNATWSEAAILDISDATSPGILLTGIITGNGTVDVNSVITRRSWRRVERDGVDMYDSSYETMRVVPDVEAVL